MILFRYLTKEVCAALAAITAVLLVIFLSNQLVRYLAYAADGRLAMMSILHLMVLEVPHLLGLLLPLGLYLGILLAHGRLYIDHEMTVLGACGVSRGQIIRYTLPIILVVMVTVAALTLWFNPKILSLRNQLLEETGNSTALQTILPGRFQEMSGGRRIAYVGKISSNRQQLKDIFLAEQTGTTTDQHWDILIAAEGYQQLNKKTSDQYVITKNSYRYVGTPGHNDFQIIHYGTYGAKVQNKVAITSTDEDALPTLVLLKANKKYLRQLAELQWRLSLPLMTVLLALLAIPLSQVRRGQGKYARFLPAILIFIVYANMLIVSRSWLSRGSIAPYLGIWWVHASMALGLACYYFQPSWVRMFEKRRTKELQR